MPSFAPTRLVGGDGPRDSRILLIAEAPGRNEVIQGVPMVGESGRRIRGAFKAAGITSLRINNVIPINPGKIVAGRRDSLVTRYWDNINDELANPNVRVIIACGAVALRRLTGMTNITKACGGVYTKADLPPFTTIRGRSYTHGLPRGAIVIPCLHPAGIMRSKIQADWLILARVIQRAVRYSRARVPGVPRPEVSTGMAGLEQALRLAEVVYIDTEYEPESRKPLLVGIATDGTGNKVFSVKPGMRLTMLLNKYLPGKLKVAHNFTADVRCLGWMGVNADPYDNWYCTMLAQATLFPDFKVGLGHCALYWLDGVTWWKDMEHDDPVYNAMDVYYMKLIHEAQRREFAAAPKLVETFKHEVMPTAPLAAGLEDRGLQIDDVTQSRLRAANAKAREALLVEIKEFTRVLFARRVMAARKNVRLLENEIDTITGEADAAALIDPCKFKKHGEYNGLRGKKFAKSADCTCRHIHAAASVQRERIAELKKLSDKYKKQITKWEDSDGFDPGNNHDLRWLLYDDAALALPKQRKDGAITCNADAVKRLATLLRVRSRPDYLQLVKVLGAIKEYQHLIKEDSTFLTPPVDERGIVHPPCRIWGAGTGRPASGQDTNIAADKGANPYSWNAFNVPLADRCIVVPHREVV